jgi:AcrR family transcriptional regulator
MAAASRLFSKSGLSEVTVAQILDHSGVKAPTLYHHFGGKEGLYVTWVSNTLDVVDAEFKALAAASPSLRGFLLEAGRILLSQRSMDVLQVLRDRKWLADPDSVEQVDDALKAAVFQPIARAIENGTPVKDGADASQIFVHMMSARRPGYKRPDMKEAPSTEDIVDLFLSGVQSSTRTAAPLGLEREMTLEVK